MENPNSTILSTLCGGGDVGRLDNDFRLLVCGERRRLEDEKPMVLNRPRFFVIADNSRSDFSMDLEVRHFHR